MYTPMIVRLCSLSLLVLGVQVEAFVPHRKCVLTFTAKGSSVLFATLDDSSSDDNNINNSISRANFLKSAAAFSSALLFNSAPAQALVKGNAPPPKKAPSGGARKCTNFDECQALADAAIAKAEEEESKLPPPSVAEGGTRYRDIVVDENSTSPVVSKNSDVEIRYKVLKLGKRSYDGLSGEGTVVFSRGYGLEDDESAPNTTSFSFTVGSASVITALSEGIVGMKLGGTRRISVLPQKGWRKPGKDCDGGPGGSGTGGELKTDYVVVPTATMVEQEKCFDSSLLPFPLRFDQQRRMAQRFDQSLIMEVELVSIK